MVDSAPSPLTKEGSSSGSFQCPMLTATNYTVWALRVKVIFNVHSVCGVIDPGTVDEKKNNAATAILFQSIPEQQILQVGSLNSEKEMWEALRTQHLGAERVREARLQTLVAEFDALKMKDSEKIDDYANRIFEISSNSATLGETFEQQKIVKKFLTSLPRRFVHIVASLEQILDLKTVGFEDVVGRLKAYEEQTKDETPIRRSRGRGQGASRNRSRGRGRDNSQSRGIRDNFKQTDEKHKDGSFRFLVSRTKKGSKSTDAKETLMMLQQVDDSVYLNEEKVLPSRYQSEGPEEGIWYLDNGASNHMTRERSFFSKLDERVVGRVRFGDNSKVKIEGKGLCCIATTRR
ncbi:uncharacterized protein LOC143568312 [Bidens hawaiensis]|uniref:uncharacterized protein LOC143568312 n=1 Tax=Bidens hawaiensis TaxID=980011 RepID=UPI00404AC130